MAREEAEAGWRHQVIYNNPVAEEAWNEDDIQV